MGVEHHLRHANNSSSPYCLATTLLLLVLVLTISTSTTTATTPHQRPPAEGLNSWKQAPPAPPAVGLGYRYSSSKAVDGDAFRPTNRGHSPGVGHDSPPTAP
ncbi:unnamed protein product [Linum trigynum]|uniref:Uncharacterized protein n=1 Tax=Linum trigynum TaxID=586398 RepID=A0AAV2DJP9_9ROSI